MIKIEDIGSGVVRRTFTLGAQRVMPGRKLTAEEIASIRTINLMALMDKKFIEVFPKASVVHAPAESHGAGERFIVSAGFGRFHVVEGVKITDEPLDKDAAEALISETDAPKKRRGRQAKKH